MRALVTRPREDADEISRLLRARGIEPVAEPLLTIEPVPKAKIALDGVQALLATSRNGVRAVAAATPVRDIPVFAVGASTAALAREAGFATVESADGDSDALEALVAARLDPGRGALFHGAGKAVAGNLAEGLSDRGFEVRRAVLYDAVPAAALSPSVEKSLRQGGFDLVLFFSPRTAETFVILLRDAGLETACTSVTGICLSSAVAQQLGDLTWRALSIAERPNMGSMIAAVDAWLARR